MLSVGVANDMSLDVESSLRSLGFRKIRKTPRGFTAICPFHQDTNPSFSIGNTGLWKCWSCGEKGNFRQLHHKLGVDMSDWRGALKVLRVQLVGKRDIHSARKKKYAKLPEDFAEYFFQEEVPPKISGRLEWPTIRQFHLGSSNIAMNAGRCIIPISFRGQYVGYHGRALADSVQPRYYNPPDFELKDYVFNYDGCEKGSELFIVEGAFNAMSMVEKGFKNTIATFGTEFKGTQIQKIFSLGPKSVVICFDRDAGSKAGQKAAVKLGNILNDLLQVYIMPLPFDKDPNDLHVDMLRECYKRRISYDRLVGGKNGK